MLEKSWICFRELILILIEFAQLDMHDHSFISQFTD
jgi:hypothetical protein